MTFGYARRAFWTPNRRGIWCASRPAGWGGTRQSKSLPKPGFSGYWRGKKNTVSLSNRIVHREFRVSQQERQCLRRAPLVRTNFELLGLSERFGPSVQPWTWNQRTHGYFWHLRCCIIYTECVPTGVYTRASALVTQDTRPVEKRESWVGYPGPPTYGDEYTHIRSYISHRTTYIVRLYLQ